MGKRTIFGNQSQELINLFEEAGSLENVMCVPLDYAKKDHVAMFCNGNGQILKKPFNVKNSPAGANWLIDQVNRSCSRRKIQTSHVFFGGEDVNSYSENFVDTLRRNGWIVAGVNAHDAKKQRENIQASTDRLDLLGIAKTLLNRVGNISPAQTGVYRNLRTLMRFRRSLVKIKTGIRNRMHTISDRLFPGFLDEQKSGVTPFSKSSLYLMEKRFSSRQIGSRRHTSLVKSLGRMGTCKPEDVAVKLREYAKQAFAAPDEYSDVLQLSLAKHVRHYRCLKENIDQLEEEIAAHLARSQGAFLASIRGIGIVLAAGAAGEIGDPFKQKALKNLVSYAGIIPRVKQSGGPEGNVKTGSVGKRCNRILKDYVVQSALHLGIQGPDELMSDYKRREAAGQHSDFGMARRYLRTAMAMMRTSQIWLPRRLRNNSSPRRREIAAYYLTVWPYMLEKWKRLGAHEVAFDKRHPLGQWRKIVEPLYDIKLPL